MRNLERYIAKADNIKKHIKIHSLIGVFSKSMHTKQTEKNQFARSLFNFAFVLP